MKDMRLLEFGTRVRWTSQSKSYRTTKTGYVVRNIPAGQPAPCPRFCFPDIENWKKYAQPNTKASQYSPIGSEISQHHRYLVKVEVSLGKFKYYAPIASKVEVAES